MSKLLYADLTNERLRRSLGGAEFSFPVLAQKSTLTIGLRFSEQIGTRHVDVYPDIQEIRATIGVTDTAPGYGQYSLKVGGGSPVVGTNVTTMLDFDGTAAELAAALNVLTVVGTATVEEHNGSFLVRGVTGTIAVYNNTLRPISFVRVLAYEVDGATTQAIRLQRAPFAFTDVFEQVVPSPPTIERVSAGGSIDDTDFPEIQKLTVPLDFQSGYRLRRSDPLKKSALIGVADGPDEIAAAINPTADGLGLADDLDGLFIVDEHPTDPASLIAFDGSMRGTGFDLLEVEVFDPKPGDYWLHLNLDTAMLAEAFREAGVDKLSRIPVEIFADIEGADEVVRTVTIYQGEVTIRESVTHSDLATAQDIDFINPPTAKQYAPVSPDSLTEGARFYPFFLGNGSDIEFQKTHSLNSPRIRVNLRENITGGRELVHGTDFEYVHDDDNAVTITLLGDYASTPPSTNGLTGTVQDLTLTSTWLGHNQAISTITGLQDIIDAFGEDIATLLALSPADFTRRLSTTDPFAESVQLPDFYEIYPYYNALPERPGDGLLTSLDLTTIPSYGGQLFAAKHDASVTELPTRVVRGVTVPALASSVYAAGGVYQNQTGADVMVDGVTLPDDGYVACDGATWYIVKKYGSGESSYYPARFERTLWTTVVSNLDLISGRLALLQFNLGAMVLRGNTPVHCHLVIEYAELTADTSPGTPGGNIAEEAWAATPVMDFKLDLTATPRHRNYGYRVKRTGDTLAADHLRSGVWTAGTAPTTNRFALRARLIRWDTVNSVASPKGYIAIIGPRNNDSVDGVGFLTIN